VWLRNSPKDRLHADGKGVCQMTTLHRIMGEDQMLTAPTCRRGDACCLFRTAIICSLLESTPLIAVAGKSTYTTNKCEVGSPSPAPFFDGACACVHGGNTQRSMAIFCPFHLGIRIITNIHYRQAGQRLLHRASEGIAGEGPIPASHTIPTIVFPSHFLRLHSLSTFFPLHNERCLCSERVSFFGRTWGDVQTF
jgi:hypothetical protein